MGVDKGMRGQGDKGEERAERAGQTRQTLDEGGEPRSWGRRGVMRAESPCGRGGPAPRSAPRRLPTSPWGPWSSRPKWCSPAPHPTRPGKSP